MFSDKCTLNELTCGKYVRHSCYYAWSGVTLGNYFVTIHVCKAGHLSKYSLDNFHSIEIINDENGESFSLRVSSVGFRKTHDVMEFRTIMSAKKLQMCINSPHPYIVTCENDRMNEKNVFMELHL
jgi:hypothetical protein